MQFTAPGLAPIGPQLEGSQNNKFGSNISVADLVNRSGLRLVVGNKSELFGFSEFAPERIKHTLTDYMVVNEVMTQCVVLQKQNGGSA